jgi:hypothetical protein
MDMTPWASFYTLSALLFRLQVRQSAASPQVLLDIPNAVGAVTLSGNVVTFTATLAQISAVPAGAYVYDFGFTAPGADFVRVDGGAFNLSQGVTR